MTTQAIALVPLLAPEYHRCPAWCQDHSDDRSGRRTHQSLRRTTVARSTASGALSEVRMWSELRDDGRGSATDVWVLAVGETRVELPRGRMHDLLQAMEATFWRLDRRGTLYPTKEHA